MNKFMITLVKWQSSWTPWNFFQNAQGWPPTRVHPVDSKKWPPGLPPNQQKTYTDISRLNSISFRLWCVFCV